MAVLFVVMLYEVIKPLLSVLKAFKAIARVQIVTVVLQRAEERFRVGIVVAHSRAAVGELHAVVSEHALRLSRLHARAVVRVHDQLPRHDAVLMKGVLQELGRIVCVVCFKNPSADDVAAVDVHDHVGVVEDPRVMAGSEVCDVPRPDLIGFMCCIACRLGAYLPLSRGRAFTQESLLAENAIQRRQGAPVLLLLIEQLVKRLWQAQVGHVRSAEPFHDRAAHLISDTARACEVPAIKPPVSVGRVFPVAVRPACQANSLTGLLLRQSLGDAFFDQFGVSEAILGTDQLSFTPQIACAFFAITNMVAVSDRALSLRASSLSLAAASRWTCTRSWRSACRSSLLQASGCAANHLLQASTVVLTRPFLRQ